MAWIDLRYKNLAGRVSAQTIAQDKALYETAFAARWSFGKPDYPRALARHLRRELRLICRRQRARCR